MRGRITALWAALCLLLTGCGRMPYPREMEDMALLRTMGVDREGGVLALTVSTGPRARGLQGDQESALVLSARGESLSAAALSLQGLSDSYVFFGYVDQLLLGEELAREDVRPVLDWFARDAELGLGARVWVVRGSAREAVESGGDRGVDSRLTTLRADGEMGVASLSRTAGEVYADLLEQGTAYLPALTVSGQEAGSLKDGGYAVFKDGALAGYLEGEEALGLELLAGQSSVHMLEERTGEETVSLRVTASSAACRLTGEGRLSLTCRVAVHLEEYRHPLTASQLEDLQNRVKTREEGRVRAALDRLRDWKADCLGLGPRAGLTAPQVWSGLQENWDEAFAAMEPEVEVRVELHP